MTGAYTDVSALEQEIIAESLRRVASVRPAVAIVIAEALIADECELAGLARLLVPEDAELTLRLLGEVLAETGGQA